MKNILFLLFFLTSVFAAEKSNWQFLNQFKLKKDQVASISWGDEENKKEILFRWTLYKNEGLVFLVKKNGFPTQHVLYRKMSLDYLMMQLVPDSINMADRVYMLFKFEDFKVEENIKFAYIDVSIKDPKNRVLVEFYDPNTKK